MLLMLMTLSAQAAGLDLLEVGGAWGTPGATNPTAIWWNPAGLAVGGGTQFIIEGAPTFAKVYGDRANPDYGTIEEDTGKGELFEGAPRDYDYSGRDEVSLTAVVPFIGVQTDFGVEGLGIGAGLAVPTATGGEIEDPWGANRYSLRSGNIQAVHAILAASYRIKKKVSFGLSGAFVDSTWSADTDTTTYPDLYNSVEDDLKRQFGDDVPDIIIDGFTKNFRDGYMEYRGYTATTVFDQLKDQAFTFGAGVYVTPTKNTGISLGYNHSIRLDHSGPLTISFQCPDPERDPTLATGLQQRGLCNGEEGPGAVLKGEGAVGYKLPNRFNLGFVLFPVEAVRLELMGSYVRWSTFTDYEIQTRINADQIPLEPTDPDDPESVQTAEDLKEETAALVSQDRQWARDGRDTFWVGVDGKHRVNDLFMYGGRVFYDRSSVPVESLMLNNFNASMVGVSGMAMVSPIDKLGISVSFAHYFMFEREVTNTNFGLSLDPAKMPEFRYQYPGGNGTYGGSLTRLGIALRGRFGHDRAKW